MEHESVHPSVTVLVGEDLFGFAQVEYCRDFPRFTGRAVERFAAAREQPTLTDEPGRDDLLFMTALPWISFTSFSHPMPTLPADSIPRFAWGKAAARDGRIVMPLAVQGHHGLIARHPHGALTTSGWRAFWPTRRPGSARGRGAGSKPARPRSARARRASL